MPNQYVNTHSVQWISANAIVRSCLRTTAPALTAEEGEEPVLVLISVADSLSALLSIYPTEYRTYLYSFSIVGASYMAMQIKLPRLGMQPME
jgi:hypothetical protein